MGKAEIIAALSRLSHDELADVQHKLDELLGGGWLDRGELSDADKRDLDSALASLHEDPAAGGSWDEVKARVQAKL